MCGGGFPLAIAGHGLCFVIWADGQDPGRYYPCASLRFCSAAAGCSYPAGEMHGNAPLKHR